MNKQTPSDDRDPNHRDSYGSDQERDPQLDQRNHEDGDFRDGHGDDDVYKHDSSNDYLIRGGAGSANVKSHNPGVSKISKSVLEEILDHFSGIEAPDGVYKTPMDVDSFAENAAEFAHREILGDEAASTSVEYQARLKNAIGVMNGDHDAEITDHVSGIVNQELEERFSSANSAVYKAPMAVDTILDALKENVTTDVQGANRGVEEYRRLLQNNLQADRQLAIVNEPEPIPRTNRDEIRREVANRTVPIIIKAIGFRPRAVVNRCITSNVQSTFDSKERKMRAVATKLLEQFPLIAEELEQYATQEAAAAGMPKERLEKLKEENVPISSNGLVFVPGESAEAIDAQINEEARAQRKSRTDYLAGQMRERLLKHAMKERPDAAIEQETTSLGALLANLPPEMIAKFIRDMVFDHMADHSTIYRSLSDCYEQVARDAYHMSYPMLDPTGRDNQALNICPSEDVTVWLPPPISAEDTEVMEAFIKTIKSYHAKAEFIVSDEFESITVNRCIVGFPASILSSNQDLVRLYHEAVGNGHLPFIFNQ